MEIYRKKDLVERAIGTLMERLILSEPAVLSKNSQRGKLFKDSTLHEVLKAFNIHRML